MRPYFLIFSLFIATSNAKAQGCSNNVAKKYIDGLFQKGEYLSYDSTQFPGYDKELTQLKTPFLNKLLPGYCFFKTTFFSNYYEYGSVETVLAFANGTEKKSLLIHSPTFTKESLQFIRLFYRITTSDTAQNVTLAREIMSIFSEITFAGRFDRLINLKEKNVISFELWTNDLSWRIYDFHFDNDNKLTRIEIKGGVKRQKISDGYKRQ